MNEELKAKLVSYLDVLEAGAKKAGEFAATEVPETIREWLMWMAIERFTYAAAYLVLSLAMFLGGLWAGRHLYAAFIKNRDLRLEQKKSYSTSDEDFFWNAALLCRIAQGLSLIPLVFGTGYWAMHGTKVLVAPRVVIIEEVSHIIGGIKPTDKK